MNNSTPLSQPTPEPLVTIVVVPRERFSYARESLDSIYAHTTTPFNLVYVDGNSPRPLRQYLQTQSVERGFKLLSVNHYLSPNHARNLGLSHVTTPYVVFADNDISVSPGWLDALVNCAEETSATVVGPLMCQSLPLHREVHFAGGESHIVTDKLGRNHLREKMYKQGKRVQEIRDQLQRRPTELAEFHCVLVRMAVFERIGMLDEQILNTKEHLDFCMTVRNAGGQVYFEPAAVVTYVPGPPLELADLPYYMLRWSDAWTLQSLQRLQDKWNLSEDGYFQHKHKKLGWRRYETIVRPFVRKLCLGRERPRLSQLVFHAEKVANRYLTTRYARRYLTPSPIRIS